MIIVRTPLRITLGGGGTDLPEYADARGGFAITAAINRHIYVGVNHMFRSGYSLKYAESEYVETIDEIKHPILREALRLYDVPPGIEIISLADIPAGTGLGSSGAFTVGLCRMLATFMGGKIHQEEAAEIAAHIELDILGRPGGKQDHYSTALGGLRELTFYPGGVVHDQIVEVDADNFRKLQDCLQIFFTGYSRDADNILSTQSIDGLDEIKAAGYQARDCMITGDFVGLGELMDHHWKLKQLRSPEMSNDRINTCYDTAIKNGAVGGKLIGAGGGGFLLFVAHDKAKLSQAMSNEGLQEAEFNFDNDGCSVIQNTK